VAAQVQAAPKESLEDIAKRLQRRQAGALEALIERTQEPCSKLALSIVKDRDLAQDALQEAYFVVYQRIGQLREAAAIQSWLYRILTNCCHDVLRRQGQPVDDEQEVPDEGPDLVDTLEKQERIRQSFACLPEIDRTALALREICSLSYEEMSSILRVPLGTIRSRLAKARQRFIQAYEGGRHAH